MQYLPIFIPTLAGVMICTLLVIFLVNRMQKPLRDLFSMLVVCILAWLLMYIGELLIPSPQLQYVAISVKYAFMSIIPVCMLLLAKTFFGEMHVFRARWALLAVPLLMSVLCWTNPLHHLFFLSVQGAMPGQMGIVHYHYGLLFYLCMAYELALMLWSMAIVMRSMTSTHTAYRRMCILLLLCIALPAVCAAIFVLANPFSGLDITPLGLAISAFLLVWVVNDAKIMDYFPIARSKCFQFMDIPLLYIDKNGFVADINAAAAKFFGRGESQLLYRQANDICKNRLNLDLDSWDQAAKEVRLRREDVEYVYLVRRTWLHDEAQNVRAQILLFFDISEIKNQEEGAHYLANYDALTGLPNRNFFAKLLQRDIDTTLRFGSTLALLAVEAHNFQQINANYGFRAGEMLLPKIGEILVQSLRRIDTVSHIQTGQFYVILPQMHDEDGLNAIIERLMEAFAAPVAMGEMSIAVTAHIGITFMPQDASNLDDLVSNADMALQLIAHDAMPGFSYFSRERFDTSPVTR